MPEEIGWCVGDLGGSDNESLLLYCANASEIPSDSALFGRGGGGFEPAGDEEAEDTDLSELYELCFRGGSAGAFFIATPVLCEGEPKLMRGGWLLSLTLLFMTGFG